MKSLEDSFSSIRLMNNFSFESLQEQLTEFGDLERIYSRLGLRSARPRDLSVMRDSLTRLPELQRSLAAIESPELKNLASTVGEFPSLESLLCSAIEENPPVVIREGGVIANGYDDQLDELRALSSNAGQFLIDLEQREKSRTGVSTLKVGYNRVHGYYIEISKGQAETELPIEYQRRQTFKKRRALYYTRTKRI